ncbi:MAG: G1 family glutamic endopeptidase [Acidimicrobiales bacterium]
MIGSYNWSGYVDTGGTFTSVSGNWTVPTATCASGKTAYSSTWIGIDGYGSQTVEQDGTDSDCSGATPAYYAWYEFYASSGSPVNNGESVELPTSSYPVSPGDAMSASVSVVNHSWTLVIQDSTKWTYTEGPVTWDAPTEASAEWIVERPEVCDPGCAITALANFGSVNFTSATATDNGTSGSISAFSALALGMLANNATTVLAAPGLLSNEGENFTDNWEALGP